MELAFLDLIEYIGILAFAASGTLVAIRKKMDIFGINVLAITTATGGGLMRDIIIGKIPPSLFVNPINVVLAAIMANAIFLFLAINKHPSKAGGFYDKLMFLFDTFGLAAFVVDGFMMGVQTGYENNAFLLVFMGLISSVGGGALRDIMANQMPDIFFKHVYGVASMAGGLSMLVIHSLTRNWNVAMVGGFSIVILLRMLSAHYRWNLPKL